MADLDITLCSREGVTPDSELVAAEAGGDVFANTGFELLVVKNAHATLARTLTFESTAELDGQPVADLEVEVPALTTMVIGPFRPSTFNDDGDDVSVEYDTEADLSVAVLKLTPP